MKTRNLDLRAHLCAIALACALVSAPALGAGMPDAWITTKVKAALLTADGVEALGVNVDTVDGRVTLHGRASSAAEKAEAERVARQIDGVLDLRNLIQVVPESRRETAAASDESLRERVTERLGQEPEVRDVTVSVSQGVVLLGGETDSLSAHLRALEIARATDGVRRVESQIQSPDQLADEEIWKTPDVGSPPRATRGAASDLWVTSAVKVRLLTADVSAMDVNVDTRDGELTLFGMVGSAAEKARAESEARKVDGVRSVRNELQVVPEARRVAAERGDAQIEQDVRKRVEDRVASGDIAIEVANGVVRLSGTVASQGERLAALTAARSSQGVRSVVGDLRVERN